MALLFGSLVLIVAIPTYMYVSGTHREQLVMDKRQALQALAESAATVLSENLTERRREIELLAQAPLYRRAPFESPEFRASLERLKASYAHYSWIGLTDAQGKVRAASQNHLLGENVSSRPWFIHGLQGLFVGDVHAAVLLARLLNEEGGEPLRFIDFSVPVMDDEGRLRGVLGAHAHWRWAGAALRAVAPQQPNEAAVELFIVGKDGRVIYPDGRDVGGVPPAPARLEAEPDGFHGWGGDRTYLTASATLQDPVAAPFLDWRIYVRQPAAMVLADVQHLQRTILAATAVAGLVLLALVWLGAARISRPVRHLTEVARRIERGDDQVAFDTPRKTLELRQLSEALSGMSSTLMRQKQALEASNQELEEKVSERTRQLTQLTEELQKLARTDALTGLANRLSANERLQQEFWRMKRQDAPYTVLLMDIDFFKKVNDTHGHPTGDQVLAHVAHVLRDAVRKTDFVARVGGEEFLVVLPATTLTAALAVAEKIRLAVEQSPIEPVGRITLSVGAHMASPEEETELQAMSAADEWLYEAKRGGRNRVASPLPCPC